ncbi:hypothetical protein DID77_03045 [Candidatus Marinamargulisbacteria bacterium SCGC AG-439-L15]|nr:hypothetical protein DID77_03045 [Candidatus Marinamargulisbacteria bacterium SCGC AG-439-L15]
MSVTFYHILHVLSLLLLSGVGFAMVFSDNRKPFQKFYGILSFLVLLGGFGLMARFGYTFKENAWMTLKLLIWIGLSVGIPIILKRTQLSKGKLVVAFSTALFLAVYLVYTKPF